MAERLRSIGSSLQMHYCSRSKDRAAFLGRIARSAYAQQAPVYFDEGDGTQKFDLAKLLDSSPACAHLYICGPMGFMEWALCTARENGWSEDRLHREYFAATQASTAEADSPFEVQIGSTDLLIPVAADETVVVALASHGIDVPVSCEQGVCGTCITRVLSGEITHRDMFLTIEEHAKHDQFRPAARASRAPGSF